jgi:hypothetical protein
MDTADFALGRVGSRYAEGVKGKYYRSKGGKHIGG